MPELAAAWKEGRRREALLTLAACFPEGSPQGSTLGILQQPSSKPPPAAFGAAEPLTAASARRELLALAADQRADALDLAGCMGHVQEMVARAAGHPALSWLAEENAALLSDLETDHPLQVAVLGVFSAGKTSLVNAILGRESLPTGLVPVTAALTVIRWGDQPSAEVVFQDGERQPLALEQLADFTDERREAGAGARAVDRVIVSMPVEILRRITLYDTPGFNSGSELHELVTERVINQADAVLWVFDVTKLGSEVEHREIRHLRRSTGKAVGLVNKVDSIRRPAYERKPEKWRAHVRDTLDELRDRSAFGELIEHWVPVSARWIAEAHEESGLAQLEATLARFEERKDQIQAEARLLHLREASRRALALQELVAHEERDARERYEDWLASSRAWAAELRSDWRDEVRCRQRQRGPAPPQCPGDARAARRLAQSVFPELVRGFDAGAAAARATWAEPARQAWCVLDGLAAALADDGGFGRVWRACLLRAQEIEVGRPRPLMRWRRSGGAPQATRRGTLLDLLLLGDSVIEDGVDAWIEGRELDCGESTPGPSGLWVYPRSEHPRRLEALLVPFPCSRGLISGLWQEREMRLVRRAHRQLLVRPEERWAVALGFLRARGPQEVAPDTRQVDAARRIEERWFSALPKRVRRHAAVTGLRDAWRAGRSLGGHAAVPDPSSAKLPARVRELMAAARPGLDASAIERLPEYLARLCRRSWWALGRVVLWSVASSFLVAVAHVEGKEHLGFDVGDSDSRAALASAALARVGMPDGLPSGSISWSDVAPIRAWLEETWRGWRDGLRAEPTSPLSEVVVDENRPRSRPRPARTPSSSRADHDQGCSRGDPASCATLGRLLLTGSVGVDSDERGASEALAKACRLGDDGAPCLQAAVLARALDAGGVGRDEATDLFALACDRGLLDGCVQAAELVTGKGGEGQPSAAGLWLSRACRGGRPASCLAAADFFLGAGDGVGSVRDACDLLVLGCGASHAGSCQRLGDVSLQRGAAGSCAPGAAEALDAACRGGQPGTCWAAAQLRGCQAGAGGLCGALLERACLEGVGLACEQATAEPRESLPAVRERKPSPR